LDANIDLEVPYFLKNIPCIVKGGMYCTEFYYEEEVQEIDYYRKKSNWREKRWVFHKEKSKYSKNKYCKDNIGQDESKIKSKLLTFGDFNKQAQKFAKAMMDVWNKGDATGQIFAFPKFQLHVNKKTFEDKKQKELFEIACGMASSKGITNFVFDRDEGITLSQCCRLKETVTDMSMIDQPETIRFTGFQNVSINLPQCAYFAENNLDKALKEIKHSMNLAMKAHLQKKKFISTLMDSEEKPLWQIGKIWKDGQSYVDLEKSTYIIGIIGLNECVQALTGKQLHEDDESYNIGIKIISFMYLYTKELSKQNNLKVVLEESPAESAGVRLAKIDLKSYEQAFKYIKGNQKSGDVYYTNSVHFSADADIDIITRVEKQSRFSSLIEAGSITHVFLGEQQVEKEAIFNLVEKIYNNTNCAQLTISPELIFCANCGHIHRGFNFMDEEE